MKQLSSILLFVFLLNSCAPVLSDLQSANHLEKNQWEVTPSLSSMSWSQDNDINQFHVGFQGGYGITDRLEGRLRYEYIAADLKRLEDDGSLFGAEESYQINAHAIGIGAKYSIIQDKLSFYLPVGLGFGSDIETNNTWQVQPTVLFTERFSDKIELTPSVKYVSIFGDTGNFIAFNLGLGLSTDLDKWVIRPEYSIAEGADYGGNFSTFSLGFSFRK